MAGESEDLRPTKPEESEQVQPTEGEGPPPHDAAPSPVASEQVPETAPPDLPEAAIPQPEPRLDGRAGDVVPEPASEAAAPAEARPPEPAQEPPAPAAEQAPAPPLAPSLTQSAAAPPMAAAPESAPTAPPQIPVEEAEAPSAEPDLAPAAVQGGFEESPQDSAPPSPSEPPAVEPTTTPAPEGVAEETSAPQTGAPPELAPAPPPPLPARAAGPIRPAVKPSTPMPAAVTSPAAPAPPPEPPAPASAPRVPGLPSADAQAEAEALEGEEFEPEELALDEILTDAHAAAAPLREGDRRSGVILSLTDDGAVVDIGGKTEGLLSLRETPDLDLSRLEPGQQIEVLVVRVGEPGEYAQLTPAHDENAEAWEAVERAYRERAAVVAKVVERVKGGLTVDVGVPAFLPGSQVDLRPTHNLDEMVGQELEVRVVKVSRRRRNVVVSRRDLLEDEIRELRDQTLAKLELGAVVTGRVKNVTSYGAFIDLGGVDGLIHVTDISYGRVKDPSEALEPGREVTAKVIKFDPEKGRVSLSLKEMEPDPWASAEERYKEGDHVKGVVASVTDYGAFVELEPGVEGLIHITEMTWSRRLKHPSKALKPGDEVESVILKVQPEERRVSLSLRQLRPDPWTQIDGRYPIGAVVEGRVRNVTTYGAFVEVEEGVDGLIHVSDFSWDARQRNPKDFVRKGQQVRAVVLNVDTENRRMSLGVKQLEPDAWETFFSNHGVGEVLAGRVTRQVKFGVFVELAKDVEGLCHNSETPRSRRGRASLETGSAYEFEIIRMDEHERRIGLRCLSEQPLEAAEAASQAD